ncbi:MAG: transglutaminase domain-containing protein [Actinomycetia bacterium]|nr:transglutaminase domain-containing protein [Actinomycetes bacterium]
MRARPTTWALGSELALMFVTAVSAWGFIRLFAGLSFLPPVLAMGVLGHAGAMVARRMALPGWLVAPAASLLGILMVTWGWYRDTTSLVVLPSSETWSALRIDADLSIDAFANVIAPAEPLTGFVVATGIAVFITALLADWAAYRLRAPIEALVPATGLFVFASLLGSGDHQIKTAMAFLLACIAFILLYRLATADSGAVWLAAEADRGNRALLRAGASLAALSVGAAAIVSPYLPGADSEALVSLRGGGGGGGSRVVISPLVDIRGRLVEQADVEVFSVRAEAPAYWRLTALDLFDGEIWASNGKFDPARGNLPDTSESVADTVSIEQNFTMKNLQAVWLPAAFEPASYQGVLDASWEPASGTLVVDSSRKNADGLGYQVVSEVSTFTPDDLRRATGVVPVEISERFLQLPSDMPSTITGLAQEITAGITNPYDQALALQNHFRDGYQYSLDVPKGHGTDAVTFFLERRTGYCEQFSGTFAAMARSLGLPSRVAVGFTPGDRDPAEDNLYRVTGKHAHAWPEVWFPEYGWVSFEPTPGRGSPQGQSHTGAEIAQETTPSGVFEGPPENAGSTDPGFVEPNQLEEDLAALNEEFDPGFVEPVDTGSDGDFEMPRLTVFSAIPLLALAYLIIVPAMNFLMARRRHRRRGAITDRVLQAWDNSERALGQLSVRRRPAETEREYAARAANTLPIDRGALLRLAADTGRVRYSPAGASDDAVARSEALVTEIEGLAKRRRTRGDEIKELLDPRNLFPSVQLPRLRLPRPRRRTA